MKKVKRKIIDFKKCSLIVVISIFASNAFAQDIEAIAKAPILTMNGAISLSQIAAFAPDNPHLDPYALFLAGNLTFNAFGTVSVPLSFAYTNQQLSGNVSLPFNRFSVSPSYRWIKAHAGYISMHFSPYSLAGHEILGGGIELTPDNGFRIAAVFGRMVQPNMREENPSFRRMGSGFSVEYRNEKFEVGANIFKAQDIVSADNPLLDLNLIPLNPQDNLSGSVRGGLSIIDGLRLSGEFGISAVNRNMINNNSAFRLLHTDGDLAVSRAGKAQLSYTFSVNTIGATYERVAPNYSTFGAYFMLNDFENITANFSTSIRNVNIALDGGYQRNNLDNQNINTISRLIYSIDLSSPINERLNLSLSLSNMQAFIFLNDIYLEATQVNEFQNLDTLNVTQLNYIGTFNASYVLEAERDRRQSTNLNFMYQKSAEAQQYSRFFGNDIFNTALSYQISFVPQQFNISTSISNNYNAMPENMYISTMTYNLSLQKTFFQSLRSSFSATFSDMNNQNGSLSNVLNVRLGGGYTLAQRHNFNLAVTLLQTGGVRKQTQYMANLSYSYSFNSMLKREEKRLKLTGDF